MSSLVPMFCGRNWRKWWRRGTALVLDVIFAYKNLPLIFVEFFSVSTHFPHPFARRLCDSPRLLVSKINLKVPNGFYWNSWEIIIMDQKNRFLVIFQIPEVQGTLIMKQPTMYYYCLYYALYYRCKPQYVGKWAANIQAKHLHHMVQNLLYYPFNRLKKKH